MIDESNSSKFYNQLQNQNTSADDYKFFSIPTYIQSKVPRNWNNLVEDAINELKSITNKVYEGQVSKGLKNGQGQIVYANGDVYKGSFKNGERHGGGLCKFATTGAIYKGEWREDRPLGAGIMFCLPNELIEARFDGFNVVDGQVKILF